MKTVTRYRTISALFSIGHLVAGTALLSVSVAFIAACAIAGQAGVLAGFNYVVPSAAIRLLAVTRIAFGYFDKYFGHLALLDDLKHSRQQQLHDVLHQRKTIAQPEAARTLHAQTELWAGRYAAVANPVMSVVATVLGLTLVYAILLPYVLLSWLGLLAGLTTLTVFGQWQYQRAFSRSYSQETQTFAARQAWLQRSLLWHLEQKPQATQYQQAIATSAKQQIASRLLSLTELSIIVVSLVWATWLPLHWAAQNTMTLYWLIPIIVASASLDWWGPIVHAAFNRHALRHAQTNLTPGSPTAHHQYRAELSHPVTQLTAQSVRWQRGHRLGKPLTFSLPGQGVALLSASSGEGKSSLFLALTGELEYQGSACVNAIELRDVPPEQRKSVLHCAEQHAHILHDTLAENLRLAAPNASDDELFQALTWAGLANWANPSSLSMWLGHQGRPISGGEQKRVILARAKLSNAPVWLLDEPFEGLDQDHIDFLAEQIINESQHRLILIASHIVPTLLAQSELVTISHISDSVSQN